MSENDTATTEATTEEVTPQEVAAVDDPTPEGAEVTEPEDAEVDDPADDHGDEGGKAAKLRKRAQEAEAERDSLRTQLSATLDRVLDYEAERIKVNPVLLRAAGLNAADHVSEDGVLDIPALAAAVEAKRAELGIPRKPQPNPVVGRGGGDSLARAGRADWDDVFA